MPRARCQGVTVTHEADQVVVLDFASIQVYYAGTTNPIVETIFANDSGATTKSNPFQSDADGNFVFYLDAELSVKLVITHPDAGVLTADFVDVRMPPGNGITILSNGSVAVGGNPGIIPTTAPGPFLYLTGVAGTPTGTPPNRTANSQYPVTIDSTGRRLYYHNGTAWTRFYNAPPTIFVAAFNASADAKSAAGPTFTCTGTNDHTVINAAFAAMPAVGGTVVLSEGTYNITSLINVPANVALRGMGQEATTIFAAAGSTNGPLIQLGANASVAELCVDGNRTVLTANTSQVCLYMPVGNSFAFHVKVKNGRGYGIFTESTSIGAMVQNCIAEVCENGFLARSSSTTLQPTILSGCIAKNCFGHGFANDFGQVAFVGCAAYDNVGGSGFFLGGVGSILSNCIARRNFTYGVTITGTDCQVVGGYYAENSQFGPNNFANINFAATSVNCSVHGATVRAGSLTNKPGFGIWLSSGAVNAYTGLNDLAGGGQTLDYLESITPPQYSRRPVKVALDYIDSSNPMNATVMALNTWVSVISQPFRVESTTSVVEINIHGTVMVGNMAAGQQCASQILINGGSPKKLGGARIQTANAYANALSGCGPIFLQGLLAPATHSVTLQVRADAAALGNCLTSSFPEMYNLAFQVLEYQR